MVWDNYILNPVNREKGRDLTQSYAKTLYKEKHPYTSKVATQKRRQNSSK